MANDLSRSVEYFRRSKDRGGDEKLMARGLLHLLKHIQANDWVEIPSDNRDFKRAKDLLDRAWKISGTTSLKQTVEALYLVAKALKEADE